MLDGKAIYIYVIGTPYKSVMSKSIEVLSVFCSCETFICISIQLNGKHAQAHACSIIWRVQRVFIYSTSKCPPPTAGRFSLACPDPCDTDGTSAGTSLFSLAGAAAGTSPDSRSFGTSTVAAASWTGLAEGPFAGTTPTQGTLAPSGLGISLPTTSSVTSTSESLAESWS